MQLMPDGSKRYYLGQDHPYIPTKDDCIIERRIERFGAYLTDAKVCSQSGQIGTVVSISVNGHKLRITLDNGHTSRVVSTGQWTVMRVYRS